MAGRQSKRVQDRTPATDARYTSKIIKAGALLPDTKTLLSHWDTRARFRPTSVAFSGRTSSAKRPGLGSRTSWRSSANGISSRMRSSGSRDAGRDRLPASALDRILFFHAAKADRCSTMSWSRGSPPCKAREARYRRGRRATAPRPMGQGRQDNLGDGTRTRLAVSHRDSCQPCGTSESSKGRFISGSHRLTCPVSFRLRDVLLEAASTLGSEAGRTSRLEAVLPAP